MGCSGSFRFDRAVKARHWKVKVHSNDVSLLSCALGSLATGSAFEIRFKERLGFLEDLVDPEDFRARTAAVMVALAMAKPGAGIQPCDSAVLRCRYLQCRSCSRRHHLFHRYEPKLHGKV